MIWVVAFILLILTGIPSLSEAACGGASPNLIVATPITRQGVVDCITAAVNGDTVTIPEGTLTDWTSSVTLSKAIILQGSGTLGTIIEDNMSSQSTLLAVQLVANQTTRIQNIRFNGGTRPISASHMINIDGMSSTVDSRRFVVENCYFDHNTGWSITVSRAYGVIANNTFLSITNVNPMYFFHNDYTWADDRWTEQANFGGGNFIFIETNTFVKDTGATRPVVDAQAGSRYVFRHNNVTRAYVEAHGTESAGRQRGTRAVEVYANTFNSLNGDSVGNTILGLRSGTALVYDNTTTNWNNVAAAIDSTNLRTGDNYVPFGIADGRNAFDKNNVANPFVTGTATVFDSATRTLTSTVTSGTAQPWTTNQWAGYTLRKTTAPCNIPIASVDAGTEQINTSVVHSLQTDDIVHVKSHVGSTPVIQGSYTVTVVDSDTITLNGVNITAAGSGGYISLVTRGTAQPTCSSQISSNGATTLVFDPAQFPPSMTYSAGDTYEINLIDGVFDQPGFSTGSDLNGTNPPTVTPNDQVPEPLYEWNNVKNGSVDLDISVRTQYALQIVEGVHYHNDTQMPGYTAYPYPHPLLGGIASKFKGMSGKHSVSGGVRMN